MHCAPCTMLVVAIRLRATGVSATKRCTRRWQTSKPIFTSTFILRTTFSSRGPLRWKRLTKLSSKDRKRMNEKSDAFRTAQQARIRALVIPREHGAWGLLLVPLFTGVVAGYASEHRIWPLLVFTVTALSLFWLRTPLESLIGTSSLTANTERERWTALIASMLLATLATACLAGLMWKGQNLQLLLLGGATALAFLIQSVLRSLGRKTRMAAQLVGAIGLVCTAPAAYYIGTGRLDKRALILWLANWIFAGNQIHFVQLRIHSARATTLSPKLAHGKFFLLAQPVLFASLATGNVGREGAVLHSFNHNGKDGSEPYFGVTVDAAGNLYGTTEYGGAYDDGSVFEVSPKAGGGWKEVILHSFRRSGTDGYWPPT